MIRVPPNELNATSVPWPFASWGMDAIGPIKPTASNGHHFILPAIDYFTKWVKAASYKAVIKKVVANCVKDRIFCRFGVPESIITDNAANLNSDLMKAMYLLRSKTVLFAQLRPFFSTVRLVSLLDVSSLCFYMLKVFRYSIVYLTDLARLFWLC
ncbi:uncharacterized protein [Nicotiana sylvestris]|uniref:uncharacterized protein n=1 Tax=Nicotiana sylvestris TaxID=4096 RepID=UPI00388C5CF5